MIYYIRKQPYYYGIILNDVLDSLVKVIWYNFFFEKLCTTKR
jgi:hypothetical protein